MQTLSDLREILGKTMNGVLEGKYTVDQARAVAQVASEVNASARLEVDMARAGFIEVDPKPHIRPAIANNRQ